MIRVFIVDDHLVVVEGIRSLLVNEAGIEWAGHAFTATACSAWFDTHEADVILMDINLPDQSGIELCAEIRKKRPKTRILALSTLNQPSYIRRMMDNGAAGYLLKNAGKQQLLDAITAVFHGQTHLCDEARAIINNISDNEAGKPTLTRREKEILGLVASGLTNVEISEKLFVSSFTVDSHRKSIMTKLDMKNTATLVKYAIDNGLV